MKIMKRQNFKQTAFIITVLSVLILGTGCSKNKSGEETAAKSRAEQTIEYSSESEAASESSSEALFSKGSLPIGQTKSLSGWQIIDGPNYPIEVTIGVKEVRRGEEAYNLMLQEDPNTPAPEEGKEYIAVTVSYSYDKGEKEELALAKNFPASLPEARHYFYLLNAEDMNDYKLLSDCIYDMTVAKGDTAEGKLVFLNPVGNDSPLVFSGYGVTEEFDIK